MISEKAERYLDEVLVSTGRIQETSGIAGYSTLR
ncbi:hypothetical protein SUSAZ_05585 [Sulfolobus acidocaldarius SUSAZ]|nr:hypothetical protein SUSAZ_05585 [Sulfolobus acidocaldarius SUSAZ]